MADLRPSSGQIDGWTNDRLNLINFLIMIFEFPDGVRNLGHRAHGHRGPRTGTRRDHLHQLTEVVNPGTSRAGRGAVMRSDDNTATLTVTANDSPHGVFGWSIDSLYAITMNEPEGSQSSSFGDGSDSASVEITVLPDTAAEGPETFFVNLTSVELISSDPQGGADPSVKRAERGRDH
ncbi:putative G protein coupled receptor 98-like protein isoform X1 [Apostichopus japonicus]|uniref:Putative G protein coupled receptor 98-like protein isoform X1 n=1 Tax=Stichopus japonicus TaxID=307972 RepID=A0A2G8KGS1_STIJA|nr:putative G protein coupled receptor 98-like protein isoform X1 [Apostichopus japonicus]